MGGIEEPVVVAGAVGGSGGSESPLQPVDVAIQEESRDRLQAATARCPGEHYRVWKINPFADGPLDNVINLQWVAGYRVAHVIAYGDETSLVLEHHFH